MNNDHANNETSPLVSKLFDISRRGDAEVHELARSGDLTVSQLAKRMDAQSDAFYATLASRNCE